MNRTDRSLELLTEIDQKILTIADTSIFVYAVYKRERAESFLDYLFTLPTPLIDSEKSFFLNALNYLTKVYLPSLKNLSKIKNFYLTSQIVDELRAQRDRISDLIHDYFKNKKYWDSVLRRLEKKQRIKWRDAKKHLQDKDNFMLRAIIVLKNYRRTLNQIINNFESDGRILHIQEQPDYELIYNPIREQDRLFRKEEEKGRRNKDTDQHKLTTAIYTAGARNCLTRIITKDSDYHKLLNRSFRQICQSLESSKFERVVTAIHFLYTEKEKIKRIITELLWCSSNGKSKGYLAKKEEGIEFYDTQFLPSQN